MKLTGTSILPIHAHQDEIINALTRSDSIVITGETGCGKSTQIPIMIYEHFLKNSPKSTVCITQPKRIAAVALAKKVAFELASRFDKGPIVPKSDHVGGLVGYSVRFDDRTSPVTRIKYMTDGMLLREYLSDQNLSSYSFICIDEVHERSLRTDILLGLLKALQYTRKLKLVIMSATLDTDIFIAFLSQSINEKTFAVNQVAIQGRKFPVAIFYCEEPQKDYLEAAVITIFQIHFESPSAGDILVFLTGQEDIEAVHAMLLENSPKDSNWKEAPMMQIVPVYAALPPHQQMKVFKKADFGYRKVILATNIAESSITIPGVKYVIDSGLFKSRVFHSNFGLESLMITPVSKASALQRSGRAGREGPGYCYRLYTEASFEKLNSATIPEIKRANLSNVVLFMKASGISDVLSFNFIDKPSVSSVISSLSLLFNLGALNKCGDITELGRLMALFPLDPFFSKTIISAIELNCAEAVISIIALLSVENLVLGSKKNYHNDYSEDSNSPSHMLIDFRHARGDHLTLLNISRSYDSSSNKTEWFGSHPFINKKSFLMALKTKDQLLSYCKKVNINATPNEKQKNFEHAILQAFFQGFSANIARLDVPSKKYKTIYSNQEVAIHPSSVLFAQKIRFDHLLFNELVFTSKPFMRGVSAMDGLLD